MKDLIGNTENNQSRKKAYLTFILTLDFNQDMNSYLKTRESYDWGKLSLHGYKTKVDTENKNSNSDTDIALPCLLPCN